MVDQIAVVTVRKAAGVGTLDVTSPLITEAFSAAVIIAARANDDGSEDDTNLSGGVLGMGFIGVDGDNAGGRRQCTQSVSLEDGVPSSVSCLTARSQTQCMRLGDGVSALDVVVVYDSSIAGGVRLSFTQCDVDVTLTVLLLAGLAKAATGGATFNDTGASHEDVGAPADLFEPDLLLFLPSANNLGADQADGILTLGYALNQGGTPQISAHSNWDDSTDPTDADGFYRTDCASSALGGVSPSRLVIQDRFQVTSFDSTGFNGIAIDTGDLNSPQANYLALKWTNPSRVRMAIAHLSVAASTGLQAFNSFGFTPDVVLGMAHLLTTPDTMTDGATAAAGGYFLTGRHGSWAYSVCEQEGLDVGGAVNSVAKTRQGEHAVLSLTDSAGIAFEAEWAGPTGAGGFYLDFTTANNAGTLTALGLQIIPAPPVAVPELAARPRVRERLPPRPRLALGRQARGLFLRVLMFWERQRRAMFDRLHPRRQLPSTPPREHLQGERDGSNAYAGSRKGTDAGAGSVDGANG